MNSSNIKDDNICLWCGEFTGKGGKEIEKKGEHIFPESIGGKLYLPKGSVCRDCNNSLNKYDKALRYGHAAMMNAYQVDPNITGKKISGKSPKKNTQRERRTHEKTKEINGEGGLLRFDNEDSRSFINADYLTTPEEFLRGLHKCIANVLCNELGSKMVRAEYPELIEFVKNGGNIQQWSYALSAPTLFNHMIISAPLLLQKIKDENGIQIIHSFIHTSGIWLVGTKPNALNPHMIGHMSQAIFDELQHDRFKNSTNREPASNYFGSNAFIPDKRIAIGPLNFYWAKAEIEGKPSDKYLYILTKCSLCGQTNPTGFSLSRDVLHDENIHGGYASSTPNTWNNYIREDLMKFGYEIEKWDKESVLRYFKQGISLSQKNDVKKMQIYDCKVKCISCGHLINYSAENCYI